MWIQKYVMFISCNKNQYSRHKLDLKRFGNLSNQRALSCREPDVFQTLDCKDPHTDASAFLSQNWISISNGQFFTPLVKPIWKKNRLMDGIKDVLCVCFPYSLLPSSSVSSWPPRARSSQVLKRAGAQPKNCGRWWCRYAASPSSTRETAMAEWAWLNTESPPWASCSGTSQTRHNMLSTRTKIQTDLT